MKNDVTKKDVLNAIIGMVESYNGDEVIAYIGNDDNTKTVTANDIIAYANKTIEQIDAKNIKAKENQAKKKTEDALRTAVENVLTEQAQTVDEIFEQVAGEDVTRAKVVARLTALIKAGLADKAETKIEGRSGKVMTYFIPKNEDPNEVVE